MPQIIRNGDVEYQVGNLVAETTERRRYLASLASVAGPVSTHLLEVATEVPHNGLLERSAFTLGRLAREAESLEAEYATKQTDPDRRLNLQLAFPELVDSFVPPDQGGRRINILQFGSAKNVGMLVPLYNIVYRDGKRIDIQSSVWIMGKMLKFLAFAHDAGLAVNDLGLGNILLETERHIPVVVDFSTATLGPTRVVPDIVKKEVKALAQSVLQVLGGSLHDGIPADRPDKFWAYRDHVLQLARVGNKDAFVAHTEFYAVVDQLWERKYHPFTTFPLNTSGEGA